MRLELFQVQDLHIGQPEFPQNLLRNHITHNTSHIKEFNVEVERKGRWQIGRAQLAGLSAKTFLQKLEQPRHF